MTKKKTVEFEEGWADELVADGMMTQEEVDELTKRIIEMVETGEIFEDATPVDEEEVFELLNRKKNTRH